jgi:hypothetical protein
VPHTTLNPIQPFYGHVTATYLRLSFRFCEKERPKIRKLLQRTIAVPCFG